MSTQPSVLRFITAGSVDDGKSTLIGRLLYDSHTLLSDQLDQLHHSKSKRTQAGVPDFASLTDGLAAEREQGITIDVAYRYFNTTKRKFIIADTPGHEQYTRNMVTGASTAHAAIVLIDASRLDFSQGEPTLLQQTKRHSALLKLLGCPHILVAVNKLDLLNYDQEKFNAITTAYARLANTIGLRASQIHYVPISALNGDNIVHQSENLPWYEGQPLLALLSELPTLVSKLPSEIKVALLPVQGVARQDGSAADDFRGYQGRLEQGQLNVGQSVRIEPAGKLSHIKELLGINGAIEQANSGDIITLTLTDDIDVSRGDSIVATESPYEPTQKITASLCWFDDRPLNPARRYWLKHGTQTVYAKVTEVLNVWDVHTLLHSTEASGLNINDIGSVRLSLQQPIVPTLYQDNPHAGAFILIDEATNQTVAAGMISALN